MNIKIIKLCYYYFIDFSSLNSTGKLFLGKIPNADDTLSANQVGSIQYSVVTISAPAPHGYLSRGLFDNKPLRMALITGVKSSGNLCEVPMMVL